MTNEVMGPLRRWAHRHLLAYPQYETVVHDLSSPECPACGYSLVPAVAEALLRQNDTKQISALERWHQRNLPKHQPFEVINVVCRGGGIEHIPHRGQLITGHYSLVPGRAQTKPSRALARA